MSFCLHVGSFLSSLPEATTFMARGSTPRRYVPHLFSMDYLLVAADLGLKSKLFLNFVRLFHGFSLCCRWTKNGLCVYTGVYIYIVIVILEYRFPRLCSFEDRNKKKKGFCFSALSREPSQYLGTSCLLMMPSKPSCCSWKRELWEKSTMWGPRVRFPSYSSPGSLLRWWDDSNTMQT